MAKPVEMPMPTSAPSGSISPEAAATSAETRAERPTARSARRDRQPLGDILDRNRRGQRQADAHVAIGETDADRHALGQVVQGDGENEQPDAVEPLAIRPARPGTGVLVRGEAIQAEHQQGPQAQAEYHGDRSEAAVAQDLLAGGQPREDQGERGCREHHAGRKAKQAVLGALRDSAQPDGKQRAERRRGEPRRSSDQGIAQVALVAVVERVVAAGQEQHEHGEQRATEPAVTQGLACAWAIQAARSVEAGLWVFAMVNCLTGESGAIVATKVRGKPPMAVIDAAFA